MEKGLAMIVRVVTTKGNLALVLIRGFADTLFRLPINPLKACNLGSPSNDAGQNAPHFHHFFKIVSPHA